jgi:pilus assembly protein Flp/PilA
MTVLLKNFFRDEAGATAMEYGLFAALIAMVIITAVTTMGESLRGNFNNVAEKVK